MPLPRELVLRQLTETAAADARIVGLLDYGSSGEGRADAWSDVDVALFIRDVDFAAFSRDWNDWAGRFGDLLFGYVGFYGHPWAIYAAKPVPLRADFDLHAESEIVRLVEWPNSPASVEAMVLYDGASGRIRDAVRQLVGRGTRPLDTAATFTSVCGDFWYFTLMAYSKFRRGEVLVARFIFDFEVMRWLYALLRFEGDLLDRWEASPAPAGLDRALPDDQKSRLRACRPSGEDADLVRALAATARMGRDSMSNTAARHDWPWPGQLAVATLAALEAEDSAS